MVLIKALVHRIFNICNTWHYFHQNISELETILARNSFPPKLVCREIRKYLNKNVCPESLNENINKNDNEANFQKSHKDRFLIYVVNIVRI